MMRPGPRHERQQTVEYVHSMLGQLRTIATVERQEMLAYLIEMAYVEAGDVLRMGVTQSLSKDKRNSAA